MVWKPPQLDSTTIMLRDICRFELPTNEEVRALLKRFADGDINARNEVVMRNMRAAVSCARQCGKGMEIEDAIQEGAIGLIRAAQKFELDRENKFITYAMWWIKQRILRFKKECTRVVRLPSHVFAKKSHWTEETTVFYQQAIDRKLVSLSAETSSSNNRTRSVTLADTIEDDAPDLLTLVQNAEMSQQVHEKLSKLERRLRLILWERANGATLQEISVFLGVTRERVRQLESKALTNLAQEFGRFKPFCTLADVERKHPKERSAAFRKSVHSWDQWFDGERHVLHKGQDFYCESSALVSYAKLSGEKRGVHVAAVHDGNGTVILRASLTPIDDSALNEDKDS